MLVDNQRLTANNPCVFENPFGQFAAVSASQSTISPLASLVACFAGPCWCRLRGPATRAAPVNLKWNVGSLVEQEAAGAGHNTSDDDATVIDTASSIQHPAETVVTWS